MNNGFTLLFDFFLPRICPGCNNKLSPEDKPVCKDCLENILRVDKNLLNYEFNRKFLSSEIIKGFYSVYVFETDKTLQHIIHALKYGKQFKIGVCLGEMLVTGIKSKNWEIDLIVPVPIHHLKKAERGFNQSDFISKGLSKSLGIPYSTKLIKRTRYTESQTVLHINERAENVANAFKIKNLRKTKDKNILLVDDVITTGATILECGKMLVNAGAKSVYACSVGIPERETTTSFQEL
jgi:ComF family protein